MFIFLPVIQTYTAIYYVVADLLMLAMYLYYKIRNRMVESECFGLLFLFYYSAFQNTQYKNQALACSCVSFSVLLAS